MEVETVASIVHAICNVTGLLGNGTVIYLVLKKTPKSLRTYSILIFNVALTDFCGCLMALFVDQRVIPIRWSLAYVSNGPCGYLGSLVCYVSYSFMLHCYAHSLWSLLISFLYRYYVLCAKVPLTSQLISVILLFYMFSLFQFVTFSFASDDPFLIENLIREHFPSYDIEGKVITGNLNIFEWKALFTILHMILPVSPIYCVIIYVRRRIIIILRGHNMSDNTKTMHTQLLNALTFQAVLPGTFLFTAVCYLLGQTGVVNHPLLECATFLIASIMPTISPFGTLYFIRPYNNWIKRSILRRSVVEPSHTVYSQSHLNRISSSTNYRVD